jgi:WD40 repeat protein
MASLFISYSRKDIEMARKLTQSFDGQGLDFWIDWEGIPPTVDWWKEIERGIQQADIFIFLLSPDSAGSKVCQREIEHAAKNGKRLIPVVVRDLKADQATAELKPLNWIFLREADDFEVGFNKLIEAVKTDYAWVQAHRQLQVKALEWEKNNHGNGFLLHGEELQDAETQLVANAAKEPHPTDLQGEYVLKSRQISDRQRRTATSAAVIGLIIVAALAVYGFVQAGIARNAQATAEANAAEAQTAQANAENRENARATAQAQAEERERIARAGELAALSVEIRENNFQVSLLLAIEAFRSWHTVRSYGALLEAANAHPQLLKYLAGYSSEVLSFAFSPDGNYVASTWCEERYELMCTKGIVQVREVSTGNEIVHTTYEGYMTSVAFSPDGKTLAAGSSDGPIILWDMRTDQPADQPLSGPLGIVNLAFSLDGKTLVAAGWNEIRMWDVETRHPIGQPLTGHEDILSVAFSPDAQTLASGSRDGTIILWDVETHQPLSQPILGSATHSVNSVAFSPDGKTLASGSDEIILWDVKTQEPMGQPLTGHTSSVLSLIFSPDGKTLASGSDEIILWDVATQEPIGQPFTSDTSDTREVLTVAFSSDGQTISSGSRDGTIILWNIEPRLSIGQPLTRHADSVFGLAFSPSGKTLASNHCGEPFPEFISCDEGEIILWDVLTHQPIGQPLKRTTGFVRGTAFSSDSQTLVSGSGAGTIAVWDVETHQLIGQPLEAGTFLGMALSPDSKTLASDSGDHAVSLWDVKTRQPIGQPLLDYTDPLTGYTDWVSSLAFSPDGKILAAGYWNRIILWDVQTQQPMGQPLTGHTYLIPSLTFSPNGKILASGSEYEIMLWDVETRQLIGQPLDNAGISLAFSPNGKTLVSGGYDNRVILWDVETQQPIGQSLSWDTSVTSDISELLSAITGVAFSPDGKTLASGSDDGTIILWNLSPGFWIEQSCQRVGRNFTRAEWERYFANDTYRTTCAQWPLQPEPTLSPPR